MLCSMCYMFDAMLLCAYLHVLRDNVICATCNDDIQFDMLNVHCLHTFRGMS